MVGWCPPLVLMAVAAVINHLLVMIRTLLVAVEPFLVAPRSTPVTT
jgi:hypothetical protein